MKPNKLHITSFFLFTLLACQTQRKPYQLFRMNEFNYGYANDFVKKIQYLPTVSEISIVDTKADGNDFVVNNQSIFLDSSQQNFPNYYSYKQRAKEINVSEDSLFQCLKTFYKVGVNDFSRDENYYRFRVVVGLTTNRGYIYSFSDNVQVGDTLPATSVRNPNYHYKVVLAKQIDHKWFEYYETR